MTMATNETPIFCKDCGANNVWRGKLATLAKVACPSCGSANLGLTGIDARP